MSKKQQPRKTWEYTQDFKVKAVELSYQEGIQVQTVAKGLDIHPMMLSRWRKDYREGKIVSDKRKRVGVKKTKITPSKKEMTLIQNLEAKVERLEKENDLLKKFQRYLAEQHQNDLDSSRSMGEN